MLNLTNPAGTADKLRLTTSSTADIEAHVSWVDKSGTTLTPGRTNTAIASIGTNDVCAGPSGTGDFRNVKFQSYRNKHASTSNDVTVKHDVNGTVLELIKVTLLAGESLVCREGVWFHYDINGGVYGVGQTFATQADMETGTSLGLIVSPGMVKYHPSSLKAWVSCGVAADIQQSFGVSSLTDNGTGDVTVNWSTSFAAATYMTGVTVEMTTTTYAVSAMRNPHIRSGGRATGSCRYDCVDNTSATSLIKDPTTWHIWAAGDFA